MRPQNWDRLLYNLSFSNAVILYSEPQDALIRYLSDIQEEFRLSYIPSLKNLTEDKLIAQIAKQLFNASNATGMDLKQLVDHYDDNNNCYVVAINGLPGDGVINQLLQMMQYLAGRFNVIFEVDADQASQFMLDYPSQTISFIGNRAKAERASRSVTKPLNKVSSGSLNPTKGGKPATKSAKSVFFWLALAMICIAFLATVGWMIFKPKVESQALQTTELKAESVQAETQTGEETAEPQTEQALDFVEQAISQKDMTAAEYFAKKQTELKTDSESPDIESSLKPNDGKPELAAEASEQAQMPGSEELSDSEQQEGDSEASDLGEPVTEQLEETVPPFVESEAVAEPEPYDNNWYQLQNQSEYVVQLTLVSSEKVLTEYLAQMDNLAELKVYKSDKFYGVTTGLYSSQNEAYQAIQDLPDKLTREGAFAKPVAAITTLISNKN